MDDREALETVLKAVNDPICYDIDWATSTPDEMQAINKVMVAARLLKDIKGRAASFIIPPQVALAIVRALK